MGLTQKMYNTVSSANSRLSGEFSQSVGVVIVVIIRVWQTQNKHWL